MVTMQGGQLVSAESPAELMALELAKAGVNFQTMAKTASELLDRPIVKTNSGEEYVDNKVRLETMKFVATVFGVKGVSGTPTVNVGIFNNVPPPDEKLKF